MGLMEDWLKCQASPLVKYRENQTKQYIIPQNESWTFFENNLG